MPLNRIKEIGPIAFPEGHQMWIKVPSERQAEGKLQEVYTKIRETRGKIANIMLVQGLNPQALQAHVELYLAVMFGRSALSRAQREMIATLVSARNGCQYCVSHHSEALRHLIKDPQYVDMMLEDVNSVTLDEKNRRMIEFAIKLTQKPNEMREADVRKLREMGFSDSEILDIVLVVGYFNMVNRIASGLGVEYDREEVTGYKYQL
jgi:uncharacterized peroxidase-related enzyme